MARFGQIPTYGRNFRRESLPWSPDLANRAYVLKRDDSWFIRSDKTSERWFIFWTVPGASFSTAMGKPMPTFTKAMAKLLEGIRLGFYPVADPR